MNVPHIKVCIKNFRVPLFFAANVVRSAVLCALFCSAFYTLLCTTSCASMQTPKRIFVYVTDVKKVYLLPPSAVEHSVSTMQLFEGTFSDAKKTSMTFIASTDCTEQKISVVMMNELGIEIASLLYSESELSLHSAFLPDGIKPEYVIMDFQNVYYSSVLLDAAYKAAGLSFTMTELDGVEHRFIKDGDVVVEMIEKKDGCITLHNYIRGYTYRLTELADE